MYLMSNCIVKAILIPKVWINMDNNFGVSYVVKEFIIYDIGAQKDYSKKEKKKENTITKYLKINDNNEEDDNEDEDENNAEEKINEEIESSDEDSDYSD